jgi:hypothetical protein
VSPGEAQEFKTRIQENPMPVKYFSAFVAVVLMLSFLGAVVFKLKEVALGVVVLIGVAMMLVDLKQSLQKPDD